MIVACLDWMYGALWDANFLAEKEERVASLRITSSRDEDLHSECVYGSWRSQRWLKVANVA